MKRILLSLLIVGFAISTNAQNRYVKSSPIPEVSIQANDKPVPVMKPSTGEEVYPLKAINQYTKSTTRTTAGTSIGVTTYDLQTNAAADDRLINTGSEVVGVWIFSLTNSLAAPDRGSGYNRDGGSGFGAAPTVRAESDRIGWPSIGITANGAEHIVSHRAGTNEMWYATRPASGTGAWTESTIPPTAPGVFNLWPRMAIGGNDGNSLHIVDVTTPTGNGGAVYQGMDGVVTYTRSEDAGATWNTVHSVLPDADSTLYANGMGADSYAIDAKGETVAVTAGRIDIDWAIWKSTDNGDTWTKTIVWDFPFDNYDDVNSITDIDNDGIADTILTVDGKVEVLIDNNGMVHVWAGAMFIFDDVIADPLGLFLSTDGLLYWNEGMGATAPVIIAQAPDRDLDGQLTFAYDYAPRYGNGGQTTGPSAAIDNVGNIAVSYWTILENTSSGNPSPDDYSFRNNFMIGSGDGGMNWEAPVNIGNSDFDECVFGSVSRDIVGGCVDVIWQQDGTPGIAVQPPNQNQPSHPFGSNDIIHECVSLATLGLQVSVNEIEDAQLALNLYPNPVKDALHISISLEKDADITFEVLNALGQVVETIEVSSYSAGDHTLKVDASSYSAGMYFVNAVIGESSKSLKFVIN